MVNFKVENTSYPPSYFRLNLLTLTFPGDLEQAFRKNYFQNSLRQIRIALLSGICMYSLFGFLDAWLVPEAKHMLWFIRFVLFDPYILFIVLFSFSHHFKKSFAFRIMNALGGLQINIPYFCFIIDGCLNGFFHFHGFSPLLRRHKILKGILLFKFRVKNICFSLIKFRAIVESDIFRLLYINIINILGIFINEGVG